MFTIIMFAVAVVAGAFISHLFVENSMGTKRFYAKDNPTPESKPYRDPHLYNDKTGKRSYRVREMRYENHTEFRAEYFIPGDGNVPTDNNWFTFNEQKMVYYSNGGSNLEWVPIRFNNLEDATNYCEKDKKKLRNETLIETIEHIV